LSPNVETQDLRLTFGARFFPWRRSTWFEGDSIIRLHQRFREMYNAKAAFSFDNGRSALQTVIEALNLPQGKSVVVQGFSCIVVPNSVQAAGARPVFVDIDKTYNIDPQALRNLLKKDASIGAVVVQHTFGTPANMDAIVTICEEKNIALIEDCAHALGTRYNGKLVGTFGVAAIFSFGRDKVVSTVSGGVAVVHTEKLATAMEHRWKTLDMPSSRWIAQRLNHPLLFWLSLHLYSVFSAGKVLIALGKRWGVFPLVLEQQEKCGESLPPRKLPNVLAHWALSQLDRLPRFNRHRRSIAQLYTEHLSDIVTVPASPTTVEDMIFFRYTIEVEDPKKLLNMAKNRGILLGDWYWTVLAPESSKPETVGYTAGDCPIAEQKTQRVLNLPTHRGVTKKDAMRVIELIQNYCREQHESQN
jgi:dTDP-4-amino-4,6-dideoxygalactose transaminase